MCLAVCLVTRRRFPASTCGMRQGRPCSTASATRRITTSPAPRVLSCARRLRRLGAWLGLEPPSSSSAAEQATRFASCSMRPLRRRGTLLSTYHVSISKPPHYGHTTDCRGLPGDRGCSGLRGLHTADHPSDPAWGKSDPWVLPRLHNRQLRSCRRSRLSKAGPRDPWAELVSGWS